MHFNIFVTNIKHDDIRNVLIHRILNYQIKVT